MSGASNLASLGVVGQPLTPRVTGGTVGCCSFPRDRERFKASRRETRLGPNARHFLVGPRRCCVLELLPTVGWGLACVSPLVSHLVVGGLVERCARRSLCFLGEPQCTSTQGSSVGAVFQPVCATLRCSRPAPRHPLLFITRRGKIDDDDD